MNRNTKTKKAAKKVASGAPKKKPSVGASIIEGLEQAIAWSRGENVNVRVTLVHVPNVNVREVRKKMGLSQAQFATKFGFPPATLRNWEQGRSEGELRVSARFEGTGHYEFKSWTLLQLQPVQVFPERPAQVRPPQGVLHRGFEKTEFVAGIVSRAFKAVGVNWP